MLKIAYLDHYKYDAWGPIAKDNWGPIAKDGIGYDLRAAIEEPVILYAKIGYIKKIPLGIKVEPPRGFYIMIVPRFGQGITMSNCVSIIGPGCRGELKVSMINLTPANYIIKPGQKIAQALIAPIVTLDTKTVSEGELSKTEQENL